jgi:hypothetical protein
MSARRSCSIVLTSHAAGGIDARRAHTYTLLSRSRSLSVFSLSLRCVAVKQVHHSLSSSSSSSLCKAVRHLHLLSLPLCDGETPAPVRALDRTTLQDHSTRYLDKTTRQDHLTRSLDKTTRQDHSTRQLDKITRHDYSTYTTTRHNHSAQPLGTTTLQNNSTGQPTPYTWQDLR